MVIPLYIHSYIYIYMYVCMYIYLYIHINIYIYIAYTQFTYPPPFLKGGRRIVDPAR